MYILADLDADRRSLKIRIQQIRSGEESAYHVLTGRIHPTAPTTAAAIQGHVLQRYALRLYNK